MDYEGVPGLSRHQVEERRKQSGYNELPDREKKNIGKVILGIISEPMIFLLLIIVGVYFLLGDRGESIILSVSVLIIIIIELFQDMRTEKALDALRTLSSPHCIVIRGGVRQTIPSRELVVGDIFVVAEGDRAPADARLIEASNVQADESLLTGESLPVDKDDSEKGQASLIYSGSMIVKGHGLAEVAAIGINTEIGKIGTSLRSIVQEKTLLQKELDRIVKLIAAVAISACVILTLVFWLTRGDFLNGFLAGLTLAISALPEEFPVVLTVFMALGAWRLAKSNVLTRRNRTIETLGSATVLCTDKTGTLTENKMAIHSVMTDSGLVVGDASDEFVNIVNHGVLASQKKPFDPMEDAFINEARKFDKSLEGVYGAMELEKEYPLDSQSLSVVHVWSNGKNHRVVAAKGAPEAILELCHANKTIHDMVKKQVAEFAHEGLRVLAVARAKHVHDAPLPDVRNEYDYEFMGLVALADPIRKEAAPAVELCHKAGVRVMMITGDSPETARHIGQEVGLDGGEVLTGSQFREMSPSEQVEAVKRVAIFSRVLPEDKLRIVEALKKTGEVVAMTGDGVNDAPALKAAHIGIAMGNRGTDVAREAASIVLLDDNFASIVGGVRLGRRIFDNLQKAVAYLLVVHIPIIALSLVPVFFGWPIILMPIHIVFLEFIIDPSCTLIFEGQKERRDIMDRPPRKLGSPLFTKQMVRSSVATGLTIAGAVVVSYAVMNSWGWEEQKARAIVYLMVVLSNLFVIAVISGRSVLKQIYASRRPTALTVITSLVLIALVVVYSLEPTRDIFKFAPLSLAEIAVSTVVALGAAILTKFFQVEKARVGHT